MSTTNDQTCSFGKSATAQTVPFVMCECEFPPLGEEHYECVCDEVAFLLGVPELCVRPQEEPRVIEEVIPSVNEESVVYGPHPRWWYIPPLEERRAYKRFVRSVVEVAGEAAWQRIAALEKLLAVTKNDWNVRYLYREIKERRRIAAHKAKLRKVAQKKHEENQKIWFELGGRERAYRRKHPFGHTEHWWLRSGLCELTGMGIDAEFVNAECWDDEGCPLKGGRLRKPRVRVEPEYLGPRTPPPPPRERDVILLMKLREKIRALRCKRLGLEYEEPEDAVWKTKFEAGEDEHGESNAPNISQHSNIVITEQHGASIAGDTPATPSAKLVSSDIIDPYTQLLSREMLFKTITWDTTKDQNSELASYNLPRDFVIDISGTPNAMPFDFNRYMRGDMIVRVQINANPFMIGSLQVAWYYQAECDKNIKSRLNVASCSQTLHTLINAGSSNEAILRIPYKNFKPMMEVGSRADKDKSLYLGLLRINVLNKLVASSTSSNAASVSIFISFENTQFTGYIHRDLNKPEMEAAAGLVALSVAEKMIDSNRDKPTTSAHPSFYCPQLAQSWCHGTNMSEDTYDLRLQRADVPHPGRYTDADFTQKDICSRFGFVRTLSWKTSVESGTQLISFAGAPMIGKAWYSDILVDDKPAYVLPPVAYMSNMFQYWRGSLTLRLDFVATKFHTGRLLLTYVPGDYQANLQLSHVKASTSVIFDLKESQQCNFTIPYMADKQYWPRYMDVNSTDSSTYAPGFVYIFVINKLVSMDNIPNEVFINMYIAGAPDFELIIPAQPTIGLSFNPKSLSPVSTEAYITNGDHYVGTYTDLELNNPSQNFYAGISRYGPLFGHVSQVWMPDKARPDYAKGTMYYLKCKDWQFNVRSDSSKSQPDVKTSVAIPFYDGDYVYVLPAQSAARCEDWCKKMIAAKGNYKEFATVDYCRLTFYNYPKGDDADPYQKEIYFEVVEVSTRVEDFEIVNLTKPEMDSRTDVETPILSGVGLVPSTSYGATELGEYHGDLKTLCRRYQLYGNAVVPQTSGNVLRSPGTVLFEFPVLPQGLDLDIGTETAPHYLWNYLREGIIPLLLAGYRFFRGSIRFRINLPDNFATYFVQHIPYAYSPDRKIRYNKKVGSSKDLFNHGYAYAVQCKTVNGVLSFEVPYYLNVDSMLLQQSVLPSGVKGTSDLAYALSLGVVRVGVVHEQTPPKGPSLFEIAYSLGDDARPSVFQGFPPVIFTGDITPIKFEMFSGLKNTMRFTKALSDVNLNQVEEKTIEALSSISDTSSAMNKLVEKLNTTGTSAASAYHEMMEALKNSQAPQILLNALSHCLQVINNPEPAVMAIAVGSFLMSLGIVCFETIKGVISVCTKIFTALLEKHQDGESAKPEAEFDTTDVSAFASMLFAGISTALNVKASADSKFSKGIASDLMAGLADGARNGSFFFRFLTNIMGTLVKIYDYIVGKLFPEKLGLEHLVSEREMVTKWCEQCMFLLNPENENLFDICTAMVDRVHSCYILGSVIMAKLSSVPKGVNTALIRDFYSKIVSLRTTLYDKGYGGTVRREPFVFWMGGEPGIGKSHLASHMCLKFLNSANIPIVGSPIYAHPAGTKYWENLNQEPIILMDDAFVTRQGEINESEIQTFMSIKSPCLFTPPMAECDRKKKRYAPEIVYVNSNNDFPELSNMECKGAVYRRRDLMFIAELHPIYMGDIKNVPEHDLKGFKHLRFKHIMHPKNPEYANSHFQYYNFDQMCYKALFEFNEFRKKQIKAHQIKVDYINESIQGVQKDPRYAIDPLAEYLKAYADTHCFPDVEFFVPHAKALLEKAKPEMAPEVAIETAEKVLEGEGDIVESTQVEIPVAVLSEPGTSMQVVVEEKLIVTATEVLEPVPVEEVKPETLITELKVVEEQPATEIFELKEKNLDPLGMLPVVDKPLQRGPEGVGKCDPDKILKAVVRMVEERGWNGLQHTLGVSLNTDWYQIGDLLDKGVIADHFKRKCMKGFPLGFRKYLALGTALFDLFDVLNIGNGLRLLYNDFRDSDESVLSGNAFAVIEAIRNIREFVEVKFSEDDIDDLFKFDGIIKIEVCVGIKPFMEPAKWEVVAKPLFTAATNEQLLRFLTKFEVNRYSNALNLPKRFPDQKLPDIHPFTPPPPIVTKGSKEAVARLSEKSKVEVNDVSVDVVDNAVRITRTTSIPVEELAKEVKKRVEFDVEDDLDTEVDWDADFDARKPDKLCRDHAKDLFNLYNVEKIAEGSRLMDSYHPAQDIDTIDKYHTAMNKLFEKKDCICPHIFMPLRTYQASLTNCCFNKLDMSHFCDKSVLKAKCKDPKCIGYNVPIMDRRCQGNCMLNRRRLRTILRGAYFKRNPGSAKLYADRDVSFPKCLLLEDSIWQSIKDGLCKFFTSIWDALKATANFFCSGIASVFRFIKRHKYIFLTALALVGGFFAYKHRGDISSHVHLAVHTTPSEIAEGVKTLYTGSKQSIKEMFRSSKNLFKSDRGGQLGDGSEVQTIFATKPEMVSSGDPRTQQRQARAQFKATTIGKFKGQPQSKTESGQNVDILRRLLIKNTVMLISYDSKVTDPKDFSTLNSSVIRGLFIGDRYCLTVVHSWEVFNKSGYDRIGFILRDRFVSCKLDAVQCEEMSDNVLCLLCFPACIPQFRTIINFLATEADHTMRTPSMGSLIKIDEHLVETVLPINPRLERLPITGTRKIRSVICDGSYSYPVNGDGLCGSVLVVGDRNAPIYGMHFAGNDGTRIGYAAPVFRETFYHLFGVKPSVDYSAQVEDILANPDDSAIDIDTCLFPVGKMPKSYSHRSASKTQIVKSEIFDYIPHKTEPAPLTPDDPRLPPGNSPLVRGVEKHGIITDDFPVDVTLRTTERVQTFIIVNNKPHRNVEDPKLTDQQSVCGDPALPFCDPLSWTTSEGYPWFAMRPDGVNDKKWLFDLEETQDGLKLNGFHPVFERHLLANRFRRFRGEMCPTIFVDCLKDARISKEKVAVPGKTRIFSMSPTDYTIDFRKYLYDFISSFQHNRFSCSNMIGVNVFGEEWNTLAITLNRHKNICTGDYSNFGPGLNMTVANECCNIIMNWYRFYWPGLDEMDYMMRECLLGELINSLHLCHDLVYRVGAGIPSGSPITAVLNSLVNIYYIYAAWDILSVDWPADLQSFNNFSDHVVLYTYGDDFIMSVSETYKYLFNTKTIAECLGRFKIKLTDAFKGEDVTAYSTLHESSFLKNRFVWHSSRWWAALDKDSIFDMCNWIRDCPDKRKALVDNCENALLHMQGWGEPHFGNFRILLIVKLGEIGIEFHPRTWKQIVKLKIRSSEDQDYAAYLHKLIG